MVVTRQVRPVIREATEYDFERRFLHSFEMRDNGRYVVTVHNGRVSRVERAETVLSPRQLGSAGEGDEGRAGNTGRAQGKRKKVDNG
jgi:hypothetical protein